MALLIAFATFFSVTLTAYGLLARTENNAMDIRLGGLRYQRRREALPDAEAAFSARVLRPLLRNVSRRANAALPSSISERLETSILQAGLKLTAGQFLVILAIAGGLFPVLVAVFFLSAGTPSQMVLLYWGGLVVLGLYGPRLWLGSRIKKRQKAIWRSLPDAFDLITASVEAGLGIDAAFSRVIEKVEGPFAAELTRTMREITMGRARRDAFQDMANRTGVDELRSLVNAIIQAEQMGISIGTVIRVQTGVIRTKRRQRAEEAAFKAPIKMVFPLVFFIFPAIMVVIGGPAILQVMNLGK
ncbi:MAG: type II secretion system F family protein [Dehalococcoidia bacterium]|nr:type II secretion system F family protein [Dehalococcoidia bacterium]